MKTFFGVLALCVAFSCLWGEPSADLCRVFWMQYQPVNFNLTNQKDAVVRIPLYDGWQGPSDRQNLTDQGLVFHMRPIHTQMMTNLWGDRSLTATFRPVRSGYLTGTVSFEQMLRVERTSRNPDVLDGICPLSPADQRRLAPLLSEGDGVSWQGEPLAKEATRLAAGSPRAMEVAAGIVVWVRRSVQSGSVSASAPEVYRTRRGDRPSRLRLAAAMLRSRGIAVRFAKGEGSTADLVDLKKTPVVRTPGGRGDWTWLEVLSVSDSGKDTWVPMGLEGPLFSIPLSIIRTRSSDQLRDLLTVQDGLLERYCQEVDVKGSWKAGLLDWTPGTGGIGIEKHLERLTRSGWIPSQPLATDLFSVVRQDEMPVAETLHLGTAKEPRWSTTFSVGPERPVTWLELLLRRLDSQGAVVRLRLAGPGGETRVAEVPTWKLADGATWNWTGFSLGTNRLKPGPWTATVELSAPAQVDWAAEWGDEDGIRRSSRVDGHGKTLEYLSGRFLLRAADSPPPKKKEKP